MVRGKCIGLTCGVRKQLQRELQVAEKELATHQAGRGKGADNPGREKEILGKVLETRDRLENTH